MREYGIGLSGEHRLSELELLERGVAAGTLPRDHSNPHGLVAAPIPSDWVREGRPIARNKLLATSTDRTASTYMWDCTAGRFDWFYDVDETVWLLEGSISVTDSAGSRYDLRAGDSFFFPCSSHFQWSVASYVRKLAFLHAPLSRNMLRAKRLLGAFARLRRPGRRPSALRGP